MKIYILVLFLLMIFFVTGCSASYGECVELCEKSFENSHKEKVNDCIDSRESKFDQMQCVMDDTAFIEAQCERKCR